MTARDSSPCDLCKHSGGRRVSSSMYHLYSSLIKMPEQKREEEVGRLLRTRPCAIAKMAVVYGNEYLAGAFVKKFSRSTKMLPHCPNRGTATCVAVSLADLAGNLERLFASSEKSRSKNEGLFVGKPDSGVFTTSYGFDSDTNQGTTGASYLSHDITEQAELRVFRGYNS